MNRKQFFGKVKDRVSDPGELQKIQWAYLLAKEVHRRQKRDEGERYFEHCRRTALILMENDKTNSREIMMALLHDSIEDGYISKDMLEALFGKEVADGVELLSKCENIVDEYGIIKKIKKHEATYYHNIDSADISVRRAKVADRLDNLRTLGIWPEKRQQKYITETEKYISPIAKATDEKLFELLKTEIEKIKKKGGE